MAQYPRLDIADGPVWILLQGCIVLKKNLIAIHITLPQATFPTVTIIALQISTFYPDTVGHCHYLMNGSHLTTVPETETDLNKIDQFLPIPSAPPIFNRPRQRMCVRHSSQTRRSRTLRHDKQRRTKDTLKPEPKDGLLVHEAQKQKETDDSFLYFLFFLVFSSLLFLFIMLFLLFVLSLFCLYVFHLPCK